MGKEYPSNGVNIIFHFDQAYRKQVVEESEPDSWIGISISVNSMYIYGSKSSGVTGFACGSVLNFLNSIKPIFESQQCIIEFEFGPSWLALYPNDEDSVEIAKRVTLNRANERKIYLDVETAKTVQKETWAGAVLDSSRLFLSMIIDMNPSLERQGVIRQIDDSITSVDQFRSELNR